MEAGVPLTFLDTGEAIHGAALGLVERAAADFVFG
jgi:hypothetical protein